MARATTCGHRRHCGRRVEELSRASPAKVPWRALERREAVRGTIDTVIAEVCAVLAAAWALRTLGQRAIVAGLRAPRLEHDPGPGTPGNAADNVRALHLVGPRGKTLAAWLVSPAGAVDGPAPAVLVMHGWGANASMMWPVVQPLHDAGFAVLLLDARCHGNSGDETFTSMPRFSEDIAAGLAWLQQQPGIASDRLALLGHSVGAAASLLHASHRRDVRAVVSLSAFAHPRDVMRTFLKEKRIPYPMVGWYVMRHVQRVIGASFDAIAPVNTISSVACPVLVVHGRADTVASAGDATRIAAASSRARLLLVNGGHDLRDALAPHSADIVEFLRVACTADSPTPTSVA